MLRTRIPSTPPELRAAVYAGDILRLPATPVTLQLVAHLRELLEQAFGPPLEQLHARYDFAAMAPKLNEIRARLASAPRYMADIAAIAGAAGHGNELAFDPLRLRCVLHDNHLNEAAKLAYSAHRDTWYGNPQCQINFWIPLQDVTAESSFMFYPEYFNQPLANTSGSFSYAEWKEKRGWQGSKSHAPVAFPAALSEPAGGQAFAARAGEIIIFSAAQLHGTVKNSSNTTRFSIDFRAVHLEDFAKGLGAPNADNGTKPEALQDYLFPKSSAA